MVDGNHCRCRRRLSSCQCARASPCRVIKSSNSRSLFRCSRRRDGRTASRKEDLLVGVARADAAAVAGEHNRARRAISVCILENGRPLDIGLSAHRVPRGRLIEIQLHEPHYSMRTSPCMVRSAARRPAGPPSPTRRRSPHSPPMKVRDLLRLLADDGWYLARTRGSHQQFKHATKPAWSLWPGSPAMISRPAPSTASSSRRG